jgi:16S rRNA (adenine1518-N6/adenine1519-N6)-dimethyltransferase
MADAPVRSGLLDPRTIRALAAELDLHPSKQRGQNFVIDPNTVRRIVALAGVQPNEVVLEVGPGLGSLTLGLLEAGANVTAVEIESSLAARLERTVSERLPDAADRLTVLEADALRITELDPLPTRVVANLPYNISVPVILHLLATFPSITSGLVMVQLEVADRLVAPPGNKVYGTPSAKLAWYASSARVGTVPATVFWPAPNVESGLVAFTRREPPATVDRQTVFDVVDAAFGQRRKMLRSALSGVFGSSADASEALLRAGIDPTRRGETLTIEEFAAIVPHLPSEL